MHPVGRSPINKSKIERLTRVSGLEVRSTAPRVLAIPLSGGCARNRLYKALRYSDHRAPTIVDCRCSRVTFLNLRTSTTGNQITSKLRKVQRKKCPRRIPAACRSDPPYDMLNRWRWVCPIWKLKKLKRKFLHRCFYWHCDVYVYGYSRKLQTV